GNKRAKALGGQRLVAVADMNLDRARQLAGQFPGCAADSDWRNVVRRDDVDLVIVATTNDQLAQATLAAVQNRKHVLVEKGAPRIAGRGEILDQGYHLIDLVRWFLGDFVEVAGHVGTFFWDWKVEDNGFAMLKTGAGQVAWLHASCTEWKNLFSFELYGRDG